MPWRRCPPFAVFELYFVSSAVRRLGFGRFILIIGEHQLDVVELRRVFDLGTSRPNLLVIDYWCLKEKHPLRNLGAWESVCYLSLCFDYNWRRLYLSYSEKQLPSAGTGLSPTSTLKHICFSQYFCVLGSNPEWTRVSLPNPAQQLLSSCEDWNCWMMTLSLRSDLLSSSLQSVQSHTYPWMADPCSPVDQKCSGICVFSDNLRPWLFQSRVVSYLPIPWGWFICYSHLAISVQDA